MKVKDFAIVGLSIMGLNLLDFSVGALPGWTQATPPTSPTVKPSKNVPPPAVMDQFYRYLNQYEFWLGDDRGACSYSVDRSSIKVDGDDRFFLAKISRGRQGTACRGVLDFRIMQIDCKTEKLYQFVREEKSDIRFAGWERYPINLGGTGEKVTRSEVAVKEICGT